MKIAKELAREARRLGICDEWHSELKKLTDKRAMVEMYVAGLDFCLSNDYPSNEYIRSNFKGVLEEYGVFLDDEIDVYNPKQLIALGDTVGQASITEYNVSRIYAKHDSMLNIRITDSAFALIDVLDDAKITIEAIDNARVCVYLYDSGQVDVKTRGENSTIKIINKQQKTY